MSSSDDRSPAPEPPRNSASTGSPPPEAPVAPHLQRLADASERNVRWLPRCTVANLAWFLAYVAAMALIVWGWNAARQSVLQRLGSPEAVAEWQAWKEEVRRQQQLPEATAVQRRLPKADEPPALVLMRDNFAPILATSLVIGTFLFILLMVLLRGSWATGGSRPGSAPK